MISTAEQLQAKQMIVYYILYHQSRRWHQGFQNMIFSKGIDPVQSGGNYTE